MKNFSKIFGIILIISAIVCFVIFGKNALIPAILLCIAGITLYNNQKKFSVPSTTDQRIINKSKPSLKALVICTAILATIPLVDYMAKVFNWGEAAIGLIILVPFWALAALGFIVNLVRLVASKAK